MRFSVSQQMRLAQQMKLAPRIIQAMEILQLPMIALQERIDSELQSNPVLELVGPSGEEPDRPLEIDTGDSRGEHDLVVGADADNSGDFERLAEFEAEFGTEAVAEDAPYRPERIDPEAGMRKMEAMANTAAREQTLNEYLHAQWVFIDAAPEIRQAGEVILDNINVEGYLRTPLESLADDGVTVAQLTAALPLVTTLEPVGVGARDLRECLRLQLAAEAAAGADVALEMELVENFLRDIERNRLPDIARRTGRTIEEIKSAIESLSHLNPRPGLLIGEGVVPGIEPDVIVDIGEDGRVWVANNDGRLPQLHISRSYRRLARDRTTEQNAKQFLRKNIQSAEWIIAAIAQRRETIRRVAEEVFDIQRDFLEDGPEALKPLPMAVIASRVGVHVATISRAVAGKYAQTPRGIFPLRMFFSGGTTDAAGQDMAWDAVKAKLKELVDAEDKSKPLNDDQLVAALKRHGISIARRTVAKYRKLLEIAPARQRRQY